jgi:hypothetical protein
VRIIVTPSPKPTPFTSDSKALAFKVAEHANQGTSDPRRLRNWPSRA